MFLVITVGRSIVLLDYCEAARRIEDVWRWRMCVYLFTLFYQTWRKCLMWGKQQSVNNFYSMWAFTQRHGILYQKIRIDKWVYKCHKCS